MESNSEEKNFKWLEVDSADVWYLLRKHAVILCVVPLLGFLAAFAATRLVKPVFEATAVSYMRPNFDKEMQLEQTYSKLDDADSLRSIERALISDTVILKMVEKLGLRHDEEFFGESIPEGGFTSATLLMHKLSSELHCISRQPNRR